MSEKAWNKVDFSSFINRFGVELIIKNAPAIKYSTKEKEHEAMISLIASMVLISALISYLILWLFFYLLSFIFLIGFMIFGSLTGVICFFLIRNYVKSRVPIKPIECWIEIHENLINGEESCYCLTYYPIFSGRRHPNKAKDVLLKLYHDQFLGDRIDITQIEIFFKQFYINEFKDEDKESDVLLKKMGYLFQYGGESSFWEEEINEEPWRYFPYDENKEDICLIVDNWMHQYEWEEEISTNAENKNDLSPWEKKVWTKLDLKPITDEFKEYIQWEKRDMDSNPKLKPWKEAPEKQVKNIRINLKEFQIINQAIEKVMGKETEIHSLSNIDDHLTQFKRYFRDLEFKKTLLK